MKPILILIKHQEKIWLTEETRRLGVLWQEVQIASLSFLLVRCQERSSLLTSLTQEEGGVWKEFSTEAKQAEHGYPE
jgi:hypothetical protein